MVSPIKSAIEFGTNLAERAFAPVTKAAGRAFTMPGQQPAGAPEFPKPTTSIPAKIPSTKPGGRRGLQESFLSGVVGGAAAKGLPSGSSWWGEGGGGSNRGGKTLIGQ